MTKPHDRVLILDCGSQYTQLIARSIREDRVCCEIHPATRSLDWIRDWAPSAIILSGGPASVYDEGVPSMDPQLLQEGIPILGICYGMQLIAKLEGEKVQPGQREYGRADLTVSIPDALFQGFTVGEPTRVWCSHGDHVDSPPAGYRSLASTATLPVAAFRALDRDIFGVQFHPEFDADVMRVYLEQRSDVLRSEGFDPARMARTIRDSSEGSALLRRFGEIVRG